MPKHLEAHKYLIWSILQHLETVNRECLQHFLFKLGLNQTNNCQNIKKPIQDTSALILSEKEAKKKNQKNDQTLF